MHDLDCAEDTTTPTTYTVSITPDKAGERLDRVLSDALPELSRTRIKALVEAGHVRTAGGAPAIDPARRVAGGESYAIDVPPPPPAIPEPQALPLSIVYEDDDLIVVDKPAGLVVHPGAGNSDHTLVNALLAHCPRGLSSIGAPLRPGIVHRLDKDTSGLLVVAKSDAAHRVLAVAFAEHSIERAYQAVVWGHPKPPAGRISKAIGRDRVVRTRMAVVRQGGKAAITHYRTLRLCGTQASVLECRLATGRTHQIRVHLSSIGHPIIGDPVYGLQGRPRSGAAGRVGGIAIKRQALHAFLIGFQHPTSGERLKFSSTLPNDINILTNFLEDF